MNYERLKTLAELLDKNYGEPNRHGFIVAPHNELQIAEHKKALIRAERLFHYQPMSDERLGVLALTRDESTGAVGYSHTRLEDMNNESLSNDETAPLINEYLEYIKSRIIYER